MFNADRVIIRLPYGTRSTFQNLESTKRLAKLGKGMMSSVEQSFVGRDERRAPLKTPVWEATTYKAPQFIKRPVIKVPK